MKRSKMVALLLGLCIGLAGSGCTSTGKEVESLDLAQCEADEGLVVVRFFTSRADSEDLEHPEQDPDIGYGIGVGTSKSMLVTGFATLQAHLEVEGEDGPALFVRKLDAGDYFFNEIVVGGGSAPLAVRFTVQPGRVTYVGDLAVLIIEDKGFLGSTNRSCQVTVSTDVPGVTLALQQRFGAVPAMDTLPMVLEQPSL